MTASQSSPRRSSRFILRASTLLTGTLLVFAAASCSEDEQKSAGSSAPSLLQLSQALCDLSMRCCDRGEVNFYLGSYVSPDNCAPRLMDAVRRSSMVLAGAGPFESIGTAIPNLGALDEAVADERGSIDPAALEACVAYLGEQPCNAPEEEPVDPDACVRLEPVEDDLPCDPRKLFIGTQGEGDPCTSNGPSFECAPELICVTNPMLGVEGRCVRPGGEGDICFADVECGEDLYCSQVDGTCQLFRKEGEACAFSDRESLAPSPETLFVRCEPELSCDPVTDTCVAPCDRGARCSFDQECDAELELTCIVGRCDLPRADTLPCGEDDDCEEGLRCATDPEDPTETVCQPRLDVGEDCSWHEECASGYCDPATDLCAKTAAAGAECLSGLDEECGAGICITEWTSCTTDDECTLGGTCDTSSFQCIPYCKATKKNGAVCTEHRECESEACIAEFCRTLPLETGQECTDDLQCESEFCSLEDTRTCLDLPLDLGKRCVFSAQCESEVCFDTGTDGPKCIKGLDEGEVCGDADQPPCNPKEFYCETDDDPAVCTLLLETGEECKRSAQCRGECIVSRERMMCSPAALDDEAICDGGGLVSAEAQAAE